MDLGSGDTEGGYRRIILVVAAIVQYVVLGLAQYLAPQYSKEPMHDSSLSGRAWLNELLIGHPGVFHICFGMQRHVFLALVVQLRLL